MTAVTAALRECRKGAGVAFGRRHVLGALPVLALEASVNAVTVPVWAGDDVQDDQAQHWHDRDTQPTH
jgi:hypothetical protein